MTVTDYLAGTAVVTIATTTRDGREITTPIWGVVVDGVGYVRNGYGESSGWYRRLRRTGEAALVDGPRRYPVRVEVVTDESVKRAVDDAYRDKYSGAGLREVVVAPARDFTLRLIPTEIERG